MSPQVNELQTLLQQLIAEHETLLRQVEGQQAAMKKLDLKAMEQFAAAQEQTRMRIGGLESRRRAATAQVARLLRLDGQPTLAGLAEALPAHKRTLLDLRQRLAERMAQVSTRAQVAGRLAGAVLGHLNTVMRLLAGAIEQAGLYTRHGVPQMSQRIGAMEAVG